jgi:transcription initiation factor TFIIIB Brf1 subunit/transcription initiation factor TFIIB
MLKKNWLNDRLKCPSCSGVTAIYPEGLKGEPICPKCGIVLEETSTISSFSQWNPQWHSNWDEQDSETLKEWLTTLRTVSCQLNIPNFPYREEVARTIRTQNRMLFRSQKLSKNKRATVAALLHLTLKEYNKTRTIKEISKELSIDTKSVMQRTWILNKTLKEKRDASKFPRKTAMDYLHQYAGKITGNNELIYAAEKIVLNVKRSGGNPIGLAAGALYHASKNKKASISKEMIGKVFQISARTVYTNEARIRRITSNKKIIYKPAITCEPIITAVECDLLHAR